MNEYGRGLAFVIQNWLPIFIALVVASSVLQFFNFKFKGGKKK